MLFVEAEVPEFRTTGWKMYVATIDGSLKEQAINRESNHCCVDVMRHTVNLRTEQARSTSAQHKRHGETPFEG